MKLEDCLVGLKHASSKRFWLLGLAIAAATEALFLLISAAPPASDPAWKRAGDGNLKVVRIRGETWLVSESQDLTPYLNVRKRGYRTIAAYRPDRPESVPAESVTMSFRDRNGEPIDITCVRVSGVIASCDENRARFGRSPDGNRIFLETGNALWVAAADGTGWRDVSGPGYEKAFARYEQLWNLPDYVPEESLSKEALEAVTRLRMLQEPSEASGRAEVSETVIERRPGMVARLELLEAVPENGPLNWVLESRWIDGRRIVFGTNRDRFPWRWESGIWVVDVETGQLEKWMDGVGQGGLYPFFANETKVVIYGGDHNLYEFRIRTKQIRKYAIHGFPISVSPDGRYALYHPTGDDGVMKVEMVVLDLEAGKEVVVVPMQDPYYRVDQGAWNKDNSKFAFTSLSIREKDYKGDVFLLDLQSRRLHWIPPSPEMGPIDPNGALSWLDRDRLVVSTTEKGSWMVNVRSLIHVLDKTPKGIVS